MSRDVPGFLDHKNAINVAHWRMKLARTQGKDLRDLRPDHELVISVTVIDNTMPSRNWWAYERPTVLRKCPEKVRFLMRRNAA